MQELLYLAHRIPYPLDDGDKVRSYHEAKHLARRYRAKPWPLNESPPDTGTAARAGVLADYSWTATFSHIDELPDSPVPAPFATSRREPSGYLKIKIGAM